jgi:hypothetical protein
VRLQRPPLRLPQGQEPPPGALLSGPCLHACMLQELTPRLRALPHLISLSLFLSLHPFILLAITGRGDAADGVRHVQRPAQRPCGARQGPPQGARMHLRGMLFASIHAAQPINATPSPQQQQQH